VVNPPAPFFIPINIIIFVKKNNMEIDYENSVTINIHKQWYGRTDDGTNFIIDGGWNEFDEHYIDSIVFTNEIENEGEMIETITDEFLLKMNG
jgi:hypothetical protein